MQRPMGAVAPSACGAADERCGWGLQAEAAAAAAAGFEAEAAAIYSRISSEQRTQQLLATLRLAESAAAADLQVCQLTLPQSPGNSREPLYSVSLPGIERVILRYLMFVRYGTVSFVRQSLYP